MSAERLIRVGPSVVRCRHHRLSHVAVSFGLSAEQLTSSDLHQLHQLMSRRLVEGAEQIEETAIEQKRPLERGNKAKRRNTLLSAEYFILWNHLKEEDVSTEKKEN